MGGFINYNCLHAFAAHAGHSLYLFARFTYKHIRSLAHSLSLLLVYFYYPDKQLRKYPESLY